MSIKHKNDGLSILSNIRVPTVTVTKLSEFIDDNDPDDVSGHYTRNILEDEFDEGYLQVSRKAQKHQEPKKPPPVPSQSTRQQPQSTSVKTVEVNRSAGAYTTVISPKIGLASADAHIKADDLYVEINGTLTNLKMGFWLDNGLKRVLKKEHWTKFQLWNEMDRLIEILDEFQTGIQLKYGSHGTSMSQATREILHILGDVKSSRDGSLFEKYTGRSRKPGPPNKQNASEPENESVEESVVAIAPLEPSEFYVLSTEPTNKKKEQPTINPPMEKRGKQEEETRKNKATREEVHSQDSEPLQANDKKRKDTTQQQVPEKRKKMTEDTRSKSHKDTEEENEDENGSLPHFNQSLGTPPAKRDTSEAVMKYFESKFTFAREYIRTEIPSDANFFEACEMAKEMFVKVIKM